MTKAKGPTTYVKCGERQRATGDLEREIAGLRRSLQMSGRMVHDRLAAVALAIRWAGAGADWEEMKPIIRDIYRYAQTGAFTPPLPPLAGSYDDGSIVPRTEIKLDGR